jgi:hypothetical protein
MQKLWGTLIVVAAVVAGMVTIASAQPCHGKIISTGDPKWNVQAACGEPSSIEESIEVVPKQMYDAIQHVYVQIPVSLTKSIWTDNIGPTSLIDLLGVRNHTLDKVETGG